MTNWHVANRSFGFSEGQQGEETVYPKLCLFASICL